MRDHEIDLISALVEGRLEDESEARALIASSPELQTEYESQKMAREALASIGTTHMREDEKAALHRDLWTALTEQPKPSRAPWYYRWVPVTAGLFIVAVGIAILGNQGGEANEERATAELATVTTAGSADAVAGASATTMAAASAADGGSAEAAPQADLEAVAKRLRLDAVTSTSAGPTQESEETQAECLVEAGLEDYYVVRTVDPKFIAEAMGTDVGEVDTRLLIAAIPNGADLKTAPITFVDSQTCTVVEVDN